MASPRPIAPCAHSPMHVASCLVRPHASAMFVVTADAAAIRAVYEQRGKFAAAVELRRRFPGITNAEAREYARTIASWKPLRPVKTYAQTTSPRSTSRAAPPPSDHRCLDRRDPRPHCPGIARDADAGRG